MFINQLFYFILIVFLYLLDFLLVLLFYLFTEFGLELGDYLF